MPDYQSQEQPSDPETPSNHHLASPSDKPVYKITRKGSRYNIIGPDGRVFSKNQSAAVVGPRWEELTYTPWPYESSAYESGLRLWELGLIPREHVGMTRLLIPRATAQPAPPPEPSRSAPAVPVAETEPAKDAAPDAATSTDETNEMPVSPASPAPALSASSQQLGLFEPATPAAVKTSASPTHAEPTRKSGTDMPPSAPPVTASLPAQPPLAPVDAPPMQHVVVTRVVLALPQPRINLDEQNRLMKLLRDDPALLFDARIRAALKVEIEYNRPQARWARTLLKVLDRYERQQRRQRQTGNANASTILAKHIAWQEEQQARVGPK